MDILISSNLERLLYYKSGKDADYIAQLMNELEATGRLFRCVRTFSPSVP